MSDQLNELARLLEKREYWLGRRSEAHENVVAIDAKITALQAEYAKTEEKP